MPATSVVGLDTAKNVFQVHGVDSSGKVTLRKRLRRGRLTDFFANLPVCVVGLEATQGAHDSRAARSTSASPSAEPLNRNANPDREPDSWFACRVWDRATQHLNHVKKMLPQLTEESETRLSGFAKRLFTTLYEELCALDQRVLVIEAELNQAFQQNALCQRIAKVEGVGPVTATAVVAAISNGTTFDNGRQFAAWLGLVPRQNSSGEKQRLSGITKRGDCYPTNPAGARLAIGCLPCF